MDGRTFDLELGVSVPMPDGVRLNADVYRPATGGRQPTLLSLTPYTCAYAYRAASAYARAGFCVVVVDVRGRGGSEGTFDLYNDAEDGACCVEWAAQQDWCDGQVALFGGSYAGLNQWAIAARAPKGLKAIAPLVAPMPGFDADGVNGVFPLYNLRWTSFIRGRGVQQPLFLDDIFWRALMARHHRSSAGLEALAGLLGGEDAALRCIIAGFDDPPYWDRCVPDEEALGRIAIPVLTATGTADNSQRGALEYRRRHLKARPDAQHFLLLGPWNHGGDRDPERHAADPDTDESRALETVEHATLLEFYNWALRGAPPPALLDGHDRAEAVYVAGLEAWRRLETRGAPVATRLHLGAGGVLGADAAPVDAALSWPSEPSRELSGSPEADPSTADLFALLGGEAAETGWVHDHAFGAFFRFESEPLTESRLFIGSPSLAGDFSASIGELDLACLVYERRADGSRLILSSDMARVRRLDQGPRRVNFETFRFASRRLAAGSRLGLQVRILNSQSFQRPGPMLAGAPLDVTLHLGPDHEATLELPLFSESEITHA